MEEEAAEHRLQCSLELEVQVDGWAAEIGCWGIGKMAEQIPLDRSLVVAEAEQEAELFPLFPGLAKVEEAAVEEAEQIPLNRSRLG